LYLLFSDQRDLDIVFRSRHADALQLGNTPSRGDNKISSIDYLELL
jgi:hypothetical protein